MAIVDALRAQIVALRAERAECWTSTADSRRASSRTRRPGRHGVHQYLVLRGGIRAEESSLDWLDEVWQPPEDRRE